MDAIFLEFCLPVLDSLWGIGSLDRQHPTSTGNHTQFHDTSVCFALQRLTHNHFLTGALRAAPTRATREPSH